jgi:radical SAM superfamily enzyme YgiQ (UPF0313 family)
LNPQPTEPPRGFPIVLTADRVLFADYTTLLDGMMAAAQTTSVPEPVMRRVLSPRVGADGARARKAPLGLRLVEAELLRAGRSPSDVAVVAPEDLGRAIGPDTRAVLVSSGDPLGRGMNDSTMSGLGGGVPYNRVWFERVMRSIARARERAPKARLIVGGPGAWQFEHDEAARRRFDIDVVFCGYAEGALETVLGDDPPRLVHAPYRPDEPVAPPAGPTGMGMVEISRGCGLGCPYCTMSARRMVHFAPERVAADVGTNVAGGVPNVALASEDFLRYGAAGRGPAPDRVIELLEAVRRTPGVRLIQVDHVNVSSVAAFPEPLLREVFRMMTRGTGQRWVWVNIGVETASGAFLAESGGAGKFGGIPPADWAGACEEAVRKLVRCGFMPMVSLIFGMPGESRRDLERTLAFVRKLRGLPVLVFPLFYAPIRPGERAFEASDLSGMHLRILRIGYMLNSVWFPRLCWDNHRAGGVPLSRRLVVQAGSYLRWLEWHARFIWRSRALP